MGPKQENRPSQVNYELRRTIGTGGMSVVYEAVDKKLQRTVALKVLHRHLCEDTAATERFKREALAAARMDHPNIVRIYDYLDESDYHCIVMEYVPGVNLEWVSKAGDGLCFDTILFIMTQVAVALAEAHSQGIMHRDVKPSNILLRRGNRVMLSDFGLARHTLDARLTQTNAVAGTPCYMSPEQISGGELNHSSDIYAWAVTFYSVFSGRLPYMRQEFPDVVSEIKEGRTTFHDEVQRNMPPEFAELLRSCLRCDPHERVRDGNQLLAMLEEYGVPPRVDFTGLVSSSGIEQAEQQSAPDISSTNVFQPHRRARGLVAGGIAVAVAILIAGGGVWFWVGRNETGGGEPAPKSAKTPPRQEEPDDRTERATKPYGAPQEAHVATTSAVATSSVAPRTARSVPRTPASADSSRDKVAPAAVDSGKLFVGCHPWAYVSVDGKSYGPTPLEKPIVLSEGKHLIRLYNEFCEPLEDEIEIAGGGEVRRRYTLERKPAYRQ